MVGVENVLLTLRELSAAANPTATVGSLHARNKPNVQRQKGAAPPTDEDAMVACMRWGQFFANWAGLDPHRDRLLDDQREAFAQCQSRYYSRRSIRYVNGMASMVRLVNSAAGWTICSNDGILPRHPETRTMT